MSNIHHIIFKSSIALSVAIGLAACSDARMQTPKTPPVSETIGASSLPDTHKNVIETFNMAAKASPETLLEAASTLELLGAKPMASEDNRAQQWQEKALSLKPSLAKGALPFRGRVKGPAYREHNLAPGETETLREVFYAAEKANLSLDPRQARIKLEVNEFGESQKVCNFSNPSDIVSCEWIPIHTAPYKITLTNTGKTSATYLLISN